MSRSAPLSHGLRVWRVRPLRDLELRRVAHPAEGNQFQLHPEFEIALVEHAPQRVRIRGATHTARPGSLLVVPPGEVHSHGIGDEVAYRSFFPDAAALRDASETTTRSVGEGEGVTPTFRQFVIDDPDLSRHISTLHRLLERPGSWLARETYAVFGATLLVARHAVRRSAEADVRNEDGPIELARSYLYERVRANVSLTELATLCGLPPRTLVRAFTRRVGMPPHAFQVQLRVNAAKRLLAAGEPAGRVAPALGFTDQSHLTRHFRRAVGVTPAAYAAAVLA